MNRRKSEASARSKSCASGGDLFCRRVVWVVLAAVIVGAALYSSALHGRFIFDDDALPFRQGVQSASLQVWLAGVRPFLMFSYWLNYRISGSDPYSYHVFNLLIHALNTGLVFVVLLRLLWLAGWTVAKRHSAAMLGAAVFLIHPLATESVSYVAGRSESLAALLLLLAYAAFLDGYAEPISWARSALVVALFGMAVATKENAVALAGVLLLTDLSWPQPYSIEGLRRNYRLYLLMSPGIMLAAVWVGRVLNGAPSAGFSLKDFTWYQYAFTQARAIFAYLRLAVIPIGQSVDHDFPVSRAVTEHGAIFCLLLLAALVTAAILFRQRYPLAAFGFLMFLLLLAPTSSVIPIADPLVERRMYLPMIGLIVMACQLASCLRWSAGPVSLLVAMLMVFGGLSYQRNQLWGKPEQVWASAASGSTKKGRPYLGLVESLIGENRCADAIPYLERGEQLMPHDFAIQVAWGKVLECQGKREDALQRLERAAAILPNSFVYQLIGLLYGEMGKKEAAGVALRKAEQLGPGNASAHSALGLWYESMGDAAEAEREYRKALSIYAYNTEAQTGLARIQNASPAARP
jgi:tetratricopeptide (TPR) repeat protein